jgi:hypothetical protein
VDLLAGRHRSKNPALARFWHAYRIEDGDVSPRSMCFLSKSEEAPTERWDDLDEEIRCHGCVARITDPRGPDSIWWLCHDPEHFGHCVVCRKTGTGGFMNGSKAILYLREEHGLRHSVSAHAVLVHKECEAEGGVTARQQGFGWEYPPAPEWGNPKAQWEPVSPSS